MSSHFDFQQELEKSVGKKLQLKINDNRSTMVSVKWEPRCTKVSLHRMFLEAPKTIMDELAGYIKKKDRDFSPLVKEFIQEGMKTLDYSHRVDPKMTQVKGRVYNLQEIYDQVEKAYFKEPLNLKITWYGEKGNVGKLNSLTLGQYHHLLRLVKVHRILDSKKYPPFLIEFVVYHEMLHHICHPHLDERGNSIVHTREFKQKEKKFKEYFEAMTWMKENQELLFEGH